MRLLSLYISLAYLSILLLIKLVFAICYVIGSEKCAYAIRTYYEAYTVSTYRRFETCQDTDVNAGCTREN